MSRAELPEWARTTLNTRLARLPWYVRFHDLMPYRVREILLVAPSYDAFILEEDGYLNERLFTEYDELGLTHTPRITRARNARRALGLLGQRRFDLVITGARLEDMRVTRFARKAKERCRGVPVALLLFDESELQHFRGGRKPDEIDLALLWTGDARMLIAGIKLIEDRLNAAHDTGTAGVRVILVVEDSIRRYSSFLGQLYVELIQQARSLVHESVNAMHQLMRVRARPKMLLATTWEEAVDLARLYDRYLMALISDVRFPMSGRLVADAGLRLAARLRSTERDLPVLLQSAETANAELAARHGYGFADKNSPHAIHSVRAFLQEALGFGPFIFRDEQDREIARAADMHDLECALARVPKACIRRHARCNHFSMWFNARNMFALAARLRAKSTTDFRDAEHLRSWLIEAVQRAREDETAGVIAKLSAVKPHGQGLFARLGEGSLGGKGRAIAFMRSLLAKGALPRTMQGVRLAIPKTFVTGTGPFEDFVAGLPAPNGASPGSDAEIVARFLERPLPEALLASLREALDQLRGPLAVRSSSLLEDSRFQPFAGIYSTWLLPNIDPDPEVCFDELVQAIKATFASTWSEDARSYFEGTPHSIADERMGIVVQELVGRRYEDRFYPHIAGVAQSRNFYPVTPQRPEDGVAMLALGLGQQVVAGGEALRVSPAHPRVLPQYPSAKEFLRASQKGFYALDLGRARLDFLAGCEHNLRRYDLSVAERDGTLKELASTYDSANDMIREGLNRPGPRVLTFNNTLRWNEPPLLAVLLKALEVLRHSFGCDVELEFAVDLGDPAARPSERRPTVYLLQARPMMDLAAHSTPVRLAGIDPGLVLARSDHALGHGLNDELRDIVYVRSGRLDAFKTPAIARDIATANERLRHRKAKCLLIGPGRWGTSDPALGIPVSWSQISTARAIVEMPFEGRSVEPSQGTHFLHNVTALRIAYLTIRPAADPAGEMLDMNWLEGLPAIGETERVRHVRLPEPLQIRMDGRVGRALILKRRPAERREDVLDVGSGI